MGVESSLCNVRMSSPVLKSGDVMHPGFREPKSPPSGSTDGLGTRGLLGPTAPMASCQVCNSVDIDEALRETPTSMSTLSRENGEMTSLGFCWYKPDSDKVEGFPVNGPTDCSLVCLGEEALLTKSLCSAIVMRRALMPTWPGSSIGTGETISSHKEKTTRETNDRPR